MRRLMVLAASIAVVLVGVGCGGSHEDKTSAPPTTTPTQAATQGRWVIRDLGTLGGPESQAYAINDHGQVIGWTDTSAKDEKGYPISHGFLWEKGKMRDFGVLPGTLNCHALAINERGQVVGLCNAGYGQPEETGGDKPVNERVFLWQHGEMLDLGAFGGTKWTEHRLALNDRGQVLVTLLGGGQFVWHDGKTESLGSRFAVAVHNQGQAINNRGQVVGFRGSPYDRYVVWEHGRLVDLGANSCQPEGPAALNDRGQVVGETATRKRDDYGDPLCHAFLWQKGKMHDLGTLPGDDQSKGEFINERGWVAGTSNRQTGHRTQTFLWRGERMIRLGSFPGDYELVYPRDLNERGQVLLDRSDTAYVWQGGKMTKLPTLGGERAEATDINERGEIVGTSETKARNQSGDPVSHAVLWTYKP